MDLEDYTKTFIDVLGVGEDELNEELSFGEFATWDSLGHMELIAAIEDRFDIMLEPEEITHFDSFENGKVILAAHGIELS